jgi:hypothetical protein
MCEQRWRRERSGGKSSTKGGSGSSMATTWVKNPFICDSISAALLNCVTPMSCSSPQGPPPHARADSQPVAATAAPIEARRPRMS